MVRLIFLMIALFLFVACGGRTSGERVLFDFESDAELDRFHWKCHTLFSLSHNHITHGEKSLRLELYPSDYPGLTRMIEKRNWSRFKVLRFDIYTHENEALTLTVRIDDREDYPDHGDRYNKSFIIRPGMNRVNIPFDTLLASGTGRKLDLRKIYRLFIFMASPERKVVLYVDYIRLVS
jgi:hypothetical protein